MQVSLSAKDSRTVKKCTTYVVENCLYQIFSIHKLISFSYM
ncbi:Uncharacterised protein [Vibrio cholerae]|nr:Uncharacterised protein [Vibrio cholerae]CSD98946.1 Uncharacterised protein [Vibrio cholerae]